MSQPLIVQKFGGSSVAQPAQIKAIAQKIKRLHDAGHPLIIVVSAMGKTTDQLLELAYNVSPTPNRRELDMLLSTGERVSMALVSMALNDVGCRAISFTGSQAGVMTTDSHSNARIIDVKPVRVEAELARGHIVVLAGFQGVSPQTKEITTLGRGGSDVTAVAMAAHFKAARCEVLKDVDGVHSADPNVVARAAHLPHLHYSQLLEMTFWGAKVLHYRSVELAALLKIPLLVALSHGEGRNTLIDSEGPMFETARILSVNSHRHVRRLRLLNRELPAALQRLHQNLDQRALPWPQILDSEKTASGWTLLITAATETLSALSQLDPATAIVEPAELSTVTATCQGSYASDLPERLSAAIGKKSIAIEKLLFSSMSVSVVVPQEAMEKTVQAVHELISHGPPSY